MAHLLWGIGAYDFQFLEMAHIVMMLNWQSYLGAPDSLASPEN